MKLKCRIDQKRCLLQGIDKPPATKTIELVLDELTQHEREYILNHVDQNLRFPYYAIQRVGFPQPGICPPDREGLMAFVRERIESEGTNRQVALP
jgi:hypothetical protein